MDYQRTAATAERLIKDAGQALTLTREVAGGYDPDIGATHTTVTASGDGVLLNYSAHNIDGTLIEVGDCKLFIGPSLSVQPIAGDLIAVGGESWRVVASRPLSPGGTVLLHECQVRRA